MSKSSEVVVNLSGGNLTMSGSIIALSRIEDAFDMPLARALDKLKDGARIREVSVIASCLANDRGLNAESVLALMVNAEDLVNLTNGIVACIARAFPHGEDGEDGDGDAGDQPEDPIAPASAAG